MSIQTPAPAEKLARAYRSNVPLDVSLSPTLVPVTIVDDLSGAGIADRGFPRNAAGSAVQTNGGAGTNSQILIMAPQPDSGILIQVTRVLIVPGASAIVQLRIGNDADDAIRAAQADQPTRGFRDVRLVGDATNAFVGSSTPLTAAMNGVIVETFAVPAGDTTLLSLDYVLGERDFLNIALQDTDVTLRSSQWWTEYVLAEV